MRNATGSLEETLTALAEHLGMKSRDAKALIDFAAEDPHTGWDFGKGAWPCGSLHTPEGKTLYALVCALNAHKVVECGALFGCSSTHLAEALKATKGATPLISVDILEGTGKQVPDHLKAWVSNIYMPAQDYFADVPDNSLDMVYEDTDHTFEVTRDIWRAAIPKVKRGGVIVSHDSEHATAGQVVTNAINEALGHTDYLTLLVPPADCGLLVWVKP